MAPSSFLSLLLILPLASTVFSRSLQASGLDESGCIATFTEGTNYFSTAFAVEPFALPVIVNTTIKNAYNFRVEYKDYYKIVKDTRVQTTYYLYLCFGANKPVVPADAGNGSFEIPLSNYGIITTVPANYLQLLGIVDQLKQVDSSLVDPCLQKYTESLPPASPAFPGPIIDAGTGPFSKPNISFSASQDEGVLNRAEWVKYLGLFFNKEDRAAAVFDNITSSYNCVKAAAPSSGTKRTAAWLSFYNGTWTLSGAAYKLQFVSDAGGQSPTEAAFGSISYSMSVPQNVTAFHDMLKGVDVVFDESFLPSGPAQYSFSNFSTNAQLDTQEQGRLSSNVWSVYGTYNPGSFFTAWLESAISSPQVVLEEILVALYPASTPTGFSNTYFYNIHHGTAKAVTAANCTASNPAEEVDPAPAFTCASKATTAPTTTPALSPPPKGGPSALALSRTIALLSAVACIVGVMI